MIIRQGYHYIDKIKFGGRRMNYIKQMMEDKGIEVNEEFYCENDAGEKEIMKIDRYNNLYSLDKNKEWKLERDRLLIHILLNIVAIEKIIKPKAKTLAEKLKKQGHGWHINGILNIYQNEIKKVDDDSLFWFEMISRVSTFLTESEAEREVYRRALEFEMQEWAREEDCLADTWDIVSGVCWSIKTGFNVYLNDCDKAREGYQKFKEKIKTYFNWGEESGENEN